jgi:hypothetical protein
MSGESRKSSGEIGDGAIKALPYGSAPQPFGVFENLQQLLTAVKTQSQFRLSRATWTSTSANQSDSRCRPNGKPPQCKIVDHNVVDAWLATWGTARE